MRKRSAAAVRALPPATASLDHQPEGRWVFDAAVAACYDDMLARSIPDYDGMRAAVAALATRFARPGTDVVDLGCSLGGALQSVLARCGDGLRYHGVDDSAPMLAAARERLADEIAAGVVTLHPLDLRDEYPAVRASVTLAVLTLQFIPIERRQRLLRRIFDATLPGGALIVVEKVLGATADLDDAQVDAYYALKAGNGYNATSIAAKRRALEGALVPLTAAANEALLRDAGFSQVDGFWRWLNFAGWVALRASEPERAPIPGVQALRGAVVVAANTPAAIHAATRDLLEQIVARNTLDPAEIASAFFTVTPDLTAAFPAKAARQLGWHHVALLCAQEIPVPGALPRCLRVLLHLHTARTRASLRPVYLRGAEQLLQDDCEPPTS